MPSALAPSKLSPLPQSPPLTKSVALQKLSKIVTEKISAFETRIACLEDEQQRLQDSLADMKQSQQKTTHENDMLTQPHDEFEKLKEESEGQGKLLLSIQKMLEGLKENGGNLDNAAVKIEKSTRDNAFNVSHILHTFV